MIKIDTTELEQRLTNLECDQIKVAGHIVELQNENCKKDQEIQILKDKVEILQSQLLHDSKTLLDSIKSFFGVKSSRLKETTIVE